jgi:chitinase
LEAAGLGIVAHQFTCPSGLYFNKQADSCDYTRNVHCEKEKKAEKASTTTTTEEPRTTTRASVSTTARVNPLYKSPSRTTQRTTTMAAYEEPSTEQLELDQEDPKVIKELIDLIKKAGGIDQLEKQLNLQEDGPSVPVNSRNGQTSTTQSSIISKSLYEKIKNRGSLFKPRTNFNGASQPENRVEKTESKEKKDTTTTTSTEAPIAANKKYATVNRFSRPNPQSAGIESLPESDAVLIEKPQYTSIRRKPAAKPSVVAENDYNGDSESSSHEESKPAQIDSKKYATISRLRRPSSPKPVEADEDEDESDDDEAEIPSRFGATSTSQKPTSKYVNLSRKRVTTTEKPEDER